MTPISKRTSLGVLGASAALLVALVTHEGYSDKAIVPVPGDRPTVGFGSTFRDDGSPVQMGDSITPVKALQRSLDEDGAASYGAVLRVVAGRGFAAAAELKAQLRALLQYHCGSPLLRTRQLMMDLQSL